MRKMVFASDESTWHVDTSILLMIYWLDLDVCRFCDPLACVLLHLMSLGLRKASTPFAHTKKNIRVTLMNLTYPEPWAWAPGNTSCDEQVSPPHQDPLRDSCFSSSHLQHTYLFIL